MFRRLLAALVIVVLAATLLIVAWPQLFGLQRSAYIAQLVSFRGAAIIGAAIVALVLLLFVVGVRRFRRFGGSLVVLLIAFGLLGTAVLATRGFGDTAFEARLGSDLTVMSWNTLGGAPGSAAIAKLALDSRADIVTLPETDAATAKQIASIMTAAGSPMVAHTVAFDQISKARSTSVLVSTALGGYHIDTGAGSTSTLPTVILQPDAGSGPTIIGAHPVAPIPKELRNWKSDLAWLSGVCHGSNVIMAGDFNSTLDHFAGFGDGAGTTIGRCTDAALRSHNAAVGTWPTTIPALLGAPIDHVMTTANWTVTGMRVVQDLDRAGSDHRPIVVQLTPAG